MSLTRVVPQNPFLLFAKNFLQHPRMLGSVVPSSRFLIQRMLDRIDWVRTRVIVEYGPGVGNVSQHLLSRLRPDGWLVLVEMNEEFVFLLRQRLHDPRVKVVHGSAANVRSILRELGFDGADVIISGIPYSTIPAVLRRRILRESRAMTSDGGEVIVYQFMKMIEKELRDCFDEVEPDFEALNLPPARIWYCK
ncbi:MAG: class I SAM-dependent methyltransferase [Acidobacteriaceae bacterium]